MKILRQLLIALLFFCGLTVIITGTSAYYSNRSSTLSEAILNDNYNSIIYGKDMLKALSYRDDEKGIDFTSFEAALKLQQNNITEKGEKEVTDALIQEYYYLKKDSGSKEHIFATSKLIYGVIEINMKALEDKSHKANITAQEFFNYFLVAVTLFVIIAVLLVVKFRSSQVKEIFW